MVGGCTGFAPVFRIGGFFNSVTTGTINCSLFGWISTRSIKRGYVLGLISPREIRALHSAAGGVLDCKHS